MFSRRMFVALAACLVLSASSALAGGGGSKRDSTIRVVSNGTNPVYAFVDVSDADLTAAASSADPIASLKALGGKEIASGGNSTTFSVKSGSHTVTVVDIVTESLVGKQTVSTTNGKTTTVNF